MIVLGSGIVVKMATFVTLKKLSSVCWRPFLLRVYRKQRVLFVSTQGAAVPTADILFEFAMKLPGNGFEGTAIPGIAISNAFSECHHQTYW